MQNYHQIPSTFNNSINPQDQKDSNNQIPSTKVKWSEKCVFSIEWMSGPGHFYDKSHINSLHRLTRVYNESLLITKVHWCMKWFRGWLWFLKQHLRSIQFDILRGTGWKISQTTLFFVVVVVDNPGILRVCHLKGSVREYLSTAKLRDNVHVFGSDCPSVRQSTLSLPVWDVCSRLFGQRRQNTAHLTVWTMWFSVVTVNPISNPIIPQIHTFEDVIPDLLWFNIAGLFMRKMLQKCMFHWSVCFKRQKGQKFRRVSYYRKYVNPNTTLP